MTGIGVIVEHSNVNTETVALIDKAIEENNLFALRHNTTYAVFDPVNLCMYHEGCTRVRFLYSNFGSFVTAVSMNLMWFPEFMPVELKRNSNGYERYMLINNNNS